MTVVSVEVITGGSLVKLGLIGAIVSSRLIARLVLRSIATLRLLNVIWIDIVVWVSIIWDQGTAALIAREFHFICIDMFHWGNNRLSIYLDDGVFGRDSCGSELWIDMVG